MSRSVSAPSSVTYTSPCWNGLIVPGSTFRYGSNFCSCTRSPRALSKRPSEAATIPFPSAETTPPVTKTYFGARALTGFQGSTGIRWTTSRRFPGAQQRVQARERLSREAAAEPDQERALDDERDLGPVVRGRAERQLGLDPVARELEREPLHGHDVQHHERPGHLRLPEIARPVRAEHLPARAGGEAAPVGLDARHARPPVGEVVRVGEERPHVGQRREQRPGGSVPGHRAYEWTLARNSCPPSMRSSSARRSPSASRSIRVCVGSPGTFSTRKWRSATAAICGRCVIATTCARSASRRSTRATEPAVSPPTPASISSNT